MADGERSSDGGRADGCGTDLRLVVVFASLPCMGLLPYWAWDTHLRIDKPGWLGLAGAVLGMAASVATLECGLRFSGEIWEDVVRSQPPGKPVPKPNLATFFWWMVVIVSRWPFAEASAEPECSR